MKKHVPFLLSLLSIMGLLAWTASVRAQCLTEKVLLDVPVDGTVNDQSAYQHTVTLYGGATYALGYDNTANGAIHFNGAGQVATIPYGSEFQTMNDGFTISAWINPTSLLNYNTVVSKLNGSHRDVVLRYHSDGKLQVHWTNSNNGISATTTDNAVIGTNSWRHVAATWDGTNMRLFVNGQMVKEAMPAEGPDIQVAGNVQIGMMTASERIVGYADKIELRGYAVESDEVACLMYGSTPVTEDIVLEMPLNNSGADVTGNSNNGTLYSVGVAADRWNNPDGAVSFSGSNSRIVVPNIAAYNSLGSEFSISAWIYPTTVSGIRTIVGKVNSGRDIVLRVHDGKLTAHYFVNNYVWCSAQTATINANEWSHIACTWDGDLKIYHNGELLQSVQPQESPNFSSASWNIGSLTSSGGEMFIGNIDEFKVWDRALSVCELRSDYQPYIDMLTEDDLVMCEGQTQTVTVSGFCSYLWMNDNSTDTSFEINATSLGEGDHEIVLEAYDYYDQLYTDTVHVNVSLCTGIEESQNDRAMKLMPNPASHSVTVMATELTEVKLTDLSGRLIRSLVPATSDRAVIEVADLPSGIYLITAIDAEGTAQVERLMKH